jgi:hypothetical protein
VLVDAEYTAAAGGNCPGTVLGADALDVLALVAVLLTVWIG